MLLAEPMFHLRCEVEKVLLLPAQWKPGNHLEGEIRARR